MMAQPLSASAPWQNFDCPEPSKLDEGASAAPPAVVWPLPLLLPTAMVSLAWSNYPESLPTGTSKDIMEEDALIECKVGVVDLGSGWETMKAFRDETKTGAFKTRGCRRRTGPHFADAQKGTHLVSLFFLERHSLIRGRSCRMIAHSLVNREIDSNNDSVKYSLIKNASKVWYLEKHLFVQNALHRAVMTDRPPCFVGVLWHTVLCIHYVR